ncbi:hypothetical protein [Shewanella atlantica]|uniref:hypothetical protein n=1 Tax=Shewanella atlantica TaxID=271099 RepID=UPI003736B077
MKDKQTDKPARFDAELHRWYQKMEQEQPGEALDKKIIEMAKQATKSGSEDNVVRVEHSFWRRYRWPLSSAASVMLVVTLLLLNPEVPRDILRDDTSPVMMQMSAPADVQGKQLDDPQALKAVAPRSMSVQPDTAADVKGSSVEEHQPLSRKGSSDQLGDSVEKQPAPVKGSTQREAVNSAKQALHHLTQLVESEQWSEAKKLALKIEERYPELREPNHPQHQTWSELQQLLKQH